MHTEDNHYSSIPLVCQFVVVTFFIIVSVIAGSCSFRVADAVGLTLNILFIHPFQLPIFGGCCILDNDPSLINLATKDKTNSLQSNPMIEVIERYVP
jgi:hypothetical protein